MKRRPFRLFTVASVTVAALAALTLAACGKHSIGANTAGANGEGGLRSTEIVHEECDIEGKNATNTDVNGDGKPDIVDVKEGGREVCRAVDLNFDGRFDTFVYFDPNGAERRRESDFDRDGQIDEIETLQGGVTTLKERETNLDGKLDTWDTYSGGKLVKRERDTNGDGRVDQWWEWPNPDKQDCPVVAVDQNNDGRPDFRQDVCKEAEAEKTAATAAPPPPATPAASSASPASPPPAGSAAPAAKGGTP